MPNSHQNSTGTLFGETLIIDTLAEILHHRKVATSNVLAVSSSPEISSVLDKNWFGIQALPGHEVAVAWGAVQANSDLTILVIADASDIVGDPFLLAKVAASQSLAILFCMRPIDQQIQDHALPNTLFWRSIGVPFLGRIATDDTYNLPQVLNASVSQPRLAVIEVLPTSTNTAHGLDRDIGIIIDTPPAAQPAKIRAPLVDQPEAHLEFNQLIIQAIKK